MSVCVSVVLVLAFCLPCDYVVLDLFVLFAPCFLCACFVFVFFLVVADLLFFWLALFVGRFALFVIAFVMLLRIHFI